MNICNFLYSFVRLWFPFFLFFVACFFSFFEKELILLRDKGASYLICDCTSWSTQTRFLPTLICQPDGYLGKPAKCLGQPLYAWVFREAKLCNCFIWGNHSSITSHFFKQLKIIELSLMIDLRWSKEMQFVIFIWIWACKSPNWKSQWL